jgi:hypothetical protein
MNSERISLGLGLNFVFNSTLPPVPTPSSLRDLSVKKSPKPLRFAPVCKITPVKLTLP